MYCSDSVSPSALARLQNLVTSSGQAVEVYIPGQGVGQFLCVLREGIIILIKET
jgi:hypothetical protein